MTQLTRPHSYTMSMPLQASNGPVGQPVVKQEPKRPATEAPQEGQGVRCFAPAEDADGCEAVITTLSQVRMHNWGAQGGLGSVGRAPAAMTSMAGC